MKAPSLDTIAHGAALELFDHEIGRVVENLYDISTAWKPARKLTVEFSFTIDEARQVGQVEVKCVTKLQNVKPYVATIFIGKERGELRLMEALKQESMFPDESVVPPLALRSAATTEEG